MMERANADRLCVCILLVLLSGCAIVSSQRTNAEAPAEFGVSYYLPKKDVIVSLTIGDAGTAPAFAVSGTDAYPDLSARFIARYHQSWIGDDDLKVGVTTNGLLSSADASFTSQASTILQNIAKTAGSVMAFAKPASGGGGTQKCPCNAKGTYSERFSIDSSVGAAEQTRDAEYCGYTVKLSRLDAQPYPSVGINDIVECDKGARHCKTYNGFFYRQEQPYLVRVNPDGRCGLPAQAAIVLSPNNAPLEFLKVERGLFANAHAIFAFTDGSLTSYEEIRPSEVAAFTAIPADVMSAYFAAIGNMFVSRKTAVQDQADYNTAVMSLLNGQQKLKACTAALAGGDQDAISKSCGSQ
jgi:hypothetical protein